MLKRLFIQNFVLFETLDIDFDEGLTVITGETGAGKSILLDALHLGLGGRADQSAIRPGKDQAQIILEFYVKGHQSLEEKLVELDISPDESLFFRRVLLKSGQSKAYLNDQPVTLATLKHIGLDLIEIISQFSTHSLLQESSYLTYLDAFGKYEKDLEKVKLTYNEWQENLKKLQTYLKSQEEFEKEKDYLSSILKELNEIAPQENEEKELIEKKSLLQHTHKFKEIILNSLSKLKEPKNLNQILYTIQRDFLKAPEIVQPQLSSISESLTHAVNHIEIVMDGLSGLLDSIAEEAYSLERLEDRLYTLRQTARKLRLLPDELFSFWTNLKNDFEIQDQILFNAQEMRTMEEESKKNYFECAQKLSHQRRLSAKQLEKMLHQELPDLKLEKAELRISFKEKEPSVKGIDHICFEFAPNPGLPFTPLHQTASGGEMSRLLLAFKVLQKESSISTLIFDEIDTGVGGAVADSMGMRLQKLSKNTQALVITHSPQIAARADRHFKVEKKVIENKAETILHCLNEKEHHEEIARMLSGTEITEAARHAAQSLIMKACA